MYDFNNVQREAMLGWSIAEQTMAQRWAQITHCDAHPYWRCAEKQGDPGQTLKELIGLLRANNWLEIPTIVDELASSLVHEGKDREWQHNVANRFLLGIGDEQHLSLESRLTKIVKGDHEYVAPESPISLNWVLAWNPPSSAKIPGKRIHLRSQTERPFEFQLEDVRGTDGRVWQIQTQVNSDEPLALYNAARNLREEGSLWLDFFRFAYPDVDFRPSNRIETSSAKLSYLSAHAMPRFQTRKLGRRSLKQLIEIATAGQTDVELQRIRGACRWLSHAVSMWPENPMFCIGILWMSLECVFAPSGEGSKGITCCRRASELYADTLSVGIAEEIQNYLLRINGTAKARQRGLRNRPEWLPSNFNREDTPPEQWAANLRRQIPIEAPNAGSLLWHLRFLEQLGDGDVKRASDSAFASLDRLRTIRNKLAHEGGLAPSIDDVDSLAALAVEVLHAGIDKALFRDGGSMAVWPQSENVIVLPRVPRSS